MTIRRKKRVIMVASAPLGAIGLIVAAHAQTVQSITANTPNLGNVVSAPTGDTVFTVTASTGAITRASGTGVRLGTGNSRQTVTIACGAAACDNRALRVRVGSIGSPTGRAQALTTFTVANGTGTTSGVSGTNPVDFTFAAMANGQSRTFHVGMNVPIAGNDSAAATGNATSGFYVYVAVSPTVPTNGSTAGLARAIVFRPLSVSSTALAFGKVVRPSTGSGTVTVNQTSGARSVTGTGVIGLAAPTPSRAAYTVTGEGGQVFSLTVPSSFQMTGPGTPLTVTLTATTANGSKTLSSAVGSAGTFAFGVGGSFPFSSTTVTGAYTGNYDVTVSYN